MCSLFAARIIHETIIGFKYIGNTALDLERDGYTVLFGYEEAIGFMLGDQIRDKDGVSATVRRTLSFISGCLVLNVA